MAARSKTTIKDSTTALGFEAKLWLAADKLRNNMVALPSQCFYSTQIPVRLWFSGTNETAGRCRAVSELELALAA